MIIAIYIKSLIFYQCILILFHSSNFFKFALKSIFISWKCNKLLPLPKRFTYLIINTSKLIIIKLIILSDNFLRKLFKIFPYRCFLFFKHLFARNLIKISIDLKKKFKTKYFNKKRLFKKIIDFSTFFPFEIDLIKENFEKPIFFYYLRNYLRLLLLREKFSYLNKSLFQLILFF